VHTIRPYIFRHTRLQLWPDTPSGRFSNFRPHDKVGLSRTCRNQLFDTTACTAPQYFWIQLARHTSAYNPSYYRHSRPQDKVGLSRNCRICLTPQFAQLSDTSDPVSRHTGAYSLSCFRLRHLLPLARHTIWTFANFSASGQGWPSFIRLFSTLYSGPTHHNLWSILVT